MQKLINHILAPIGSGKKWAIVAERAIHMANHFQCSLHLLYVENTALVPFFGTPDEDDKGNPRKKLSVLNERFGSLLEPGLPLHLSSCKGGDAEQLIAEYAIRNFIDVIVVSPSGTPLSGSLFGSLSINRLARKTRAAVLTVNDQPFEKVRNIVLPVAAQLPMKKLMLASYMARKYNATIHLIGLTKRHPHNSVNDTLYLYKTFQLLRDNTNLAVEYHILPGENIADKTLEYAQRINADLIVVNPGKELLLSGFINKLFARFIFNESAIPVLTINPAD